MIDYVNKRKDGADPDEDGKVFQTLPRYMAPTISKIKHHDENQSGIEPVDIRKQLRKDVSRENGSKSMIGAKNAWRPGGAREVSNEKSFRDPHIKKESVNYLTENSIMGAGSQMGMSNKGSVSKKSQQTLVNRLFEEGQLKKSKQDFYEQEK